MKWNKFYLITVVTTSVVVPYMVGSSLVFKDLALIQFSMPSDMVKTLVAFVFFGFIAAMLPVLPLLFLNLIPVGLAFLIFKILNGNTQIITWIFIVYHLLFVITSLYTIKAGKLMMIQERDAQRNK